MIAEKSIFGSIEGEKVYRYTLKNAKGESADILNLGGIVQSLNVLNGSGGLTDVVLGYDTAEEYINNKGYLGALIGRYANRISKGRFTLNGKTYSLNINNGENHLHGGLCGFDKKLWQAELSGEKLCLKLFSPDIDEGYPGNLNVEVSYMFTDDSELIIEYYAVSDKDTIVNLTNHSYFNLDGEGDALSHYLKINAKEFLPVNQATLPLGEIREVKNTPFDFTDFKQIKKDIYSTDEQLEFCGGYDHNYILGEGCKLAAEVFSKLSNIKVQVFTDKRGVQFYSGNYLNGRGKGGRIYNKHYGICLETQHYPDSVNIPHFPSPILKAGQAYRYKTVYKFGLV
jgi:aldose 1-epimerase